MATVPKVLWQTWKTTQIPSEMQKYRDKWLQLCPESQGWSHPLLTDDDLLELVKANFPQYLSAYQGFRKNIERVDFARCVMLFIGGVYSDLDAYPLKDITEWIDKGKIVLGTEPIEHARELYGKTELLCNAFMISPPRQDFWIQLMDYIIANYDPSTGAVENTGPLSMTLFKETHPEAFKDVIVTKPCVFFPLKKDGSVTEGCDMERESFVAHVWLGSWLEWPSPTSPVVLLLGLFVILWLWFYFMSAR